MLHRPGITLLWGTTRASGPEATDRPAQVFSTLHVNGEIAYPVQEITIAGNLREMFANIRAIGTDVDPRSSILTGSILVGKMTVAGE